MSSGRNFEAKKQRIMLWSYFMELCVLLISSKFLGKIGMTFFALAYAFYLFCLILSGIRSPQILGNMLRMQGNKSRFKNANKLKKSAFFLQFYASLAFAILMLISGRAFTVEFLGQDYASKMIGLLAVSLVVRSVTNVLLGFFEGEGAYLPAVCVALFRPILILLVSLCLVNAFRIYGTKVSVLLKNDHFIYMYTALGITIAILLVEIFLFLFIAFSSLKSGRKHPKRKEGMKSTEGFAGQAFSLCSNLFPQNLNDLLTVFPLFAGIAIYCLRMKGGELIFHLGLFVGKIIPFVLLFAVPGMVFVTDNAHRMADCFKKDEMRYARNYFGAGFHCAVLYGLFLSVFAFVMSADIALVICKTEVKLVTGLMRYSAFLILFVVMNYFLLTIIRLLGGRFRVLGLLAFRGVVSAVSCVLLLNGKETIEALVFSALLSEACLTLAALILAICVLRFRIDWLQWVGVPAVGGCVVGLIALFFSNIISPHLGALFSVCLSFLISLLIYAAGLLLLRNFREQELSYMPFGPQLKALGRIFQIYD